MGDKPFIIDNDNNDDLTLEKYEYDINPPEGQNHPDGDTDSTIPSVGDNLDSVKHYLNLLLEGPAQPQGYNYYFKQGTCDVSGSVDECKGEDRYIFVRNIPDGKIPCSGDLEVDLKGFVPGIFQDIMDVNPLNLGKGLMGEGILSKKCVKVEKEVGSAGNFKKVKVCSPPEQEQIPCLTEFFDNNNSDNNNNNNKYKDYNNTTRSKNNLYKYTCSVFCLLIILLLVYHLFKNL